MLQIHRRNAWKLRTFAWAAVSSLGAVVAVSFIASRPAAVETSSPRSDTKAVSAEPLLERAAVAPIAPGSRIDPHALPPGMHLLLRYRLKPNSGDVRKLRSSIRTTIESFTTLVTVETEPDPTQSGRFRRAAHRIGIGMPSNGGDTVVTKDSATNAGGELGPIDLKILGERETDLNLVRSPASSPTMAMFDFPMSFLREEQRIPIVVRYVALVEPADGIVTTLYWVLDVTADGNRFVGDFVWILTPDYEADWHLHVDGGKVTLGIPLADTFTSTRLPAGTARPVERKFQTAAMARSFSVGSANELEHHARGLLHHH